MTSSISAIPVNESLERACREGPLDTDIVLEVTPPERGEGLSAGTNLARALYQTEEGGGVRNKNNSPMAAMEIWYEHESLRFFYVLPSQKQESHYRRQLSGYYEGLDIETQIETEDKFLSLTEGEHVAATQLGMKKHFFEPIASGGDDEDPYQSILGEVDTKDNTKTLIQVLYRPALLQWHEVGGTSLREYANEVREQSMESGDDEDSTVSHQAIRDRAGEPAYHTELRIAVISEDKTHAESHLEDVISQFSTACRGPTGQTFEPVSFDTHALLANMIRRNGMYLNSPTTREYMSYSLKNSIGSSPSPWMVLTIPEFSSLVHLPSESDITVDGVQYNNQPVQGTLPPEAKSFEPIGEEERRAMAEDDEDVWSMMTGDSYGRFNTRTGEREAVKSGDSE